MALGRFDGLPRSPRTPRRGRAFARRSLVAHLRARARTPSAPPCSASVRARRSFVAHIRASPASSDAAARPSRRRVAAASPSCPTRTYVGCSTNPGAPRRGAATRRSSRTPRTPRRGRAPPNPSTSARCARPRASASSATRASSSTATPSSSRRSPRRTSSQCGARDDPPLGPRRVPVHRRAVAPFVHVIRVPRRRELRPRGGDRPRRRRLRGPELRRRRRAFRVPVSPKPNPKADTLEPSPAEGARVVCDDDERVAEAEDRDAVRIAEGTSRPCEWTERLSRRGARYASNQARSSELAHRKRRWGRAGLRGEQTWCTRTRETRVTGVESTTGNRRRANRRRDDGESTTGNRRRGIALRRVN